MTEAEIQEAGEELRDTVDLILETEYADQDPLPIVRAMVELYRNELD